jgi:hypothetical protein
MKFLAVTALLALAASASANVLRGAAPKLGKIARRVNVGKLISRIPRPRALEGHTTSVDMCAADDMDPCMDSTCEMWDANKASLEDAVERLETCDWTEESTMSSTTMSVNFAECDAVSDFESTCGSAEGEFRTEDMHITCTGPDMDGFTVNFEYTGLPACFGHACNTEWQGLEELEMIVTNEVMEGLKDFIEEETGKEEVEIHCDGVINPERLRDINPGRLSSFVKSLN